MIKLIRFLFDKVYSELIRPRKFGSPKVEKEPAVNVGTVINNYTDNRAVNNNTTNNLVSLENSSFPLLNYPKDAHPTLSGKYSQYLSSLPSSGLNVASRMTSVSFDSIYTRSNGNFYGQDMRNRRALALADGRDGSEYKDFLVKHLENKEMLERLDIALDVYSPDQNVDFWPNVLKSLCSGFYHSHYKNICLIFPGGHRVVFNSANRSGYNLFFSPKDEVQRFSYYEELAVVFLNRSIPMIPESLYVGSLSPSGRDQLGQKGYRTQLHVYNKGKQTGFLDRAFVNTLRFEFRFRFKPSEETSTIARKSFRARDLGLRILSASPEQHPAICQSEFFPFLFGDLLVDAISFRKPSFKAERRINKGTFDFKTDTIRKWRSPEWWDKYLEWMVDSDVNRVLFEDGLIALPLTAKRPYPGSGLDSRSFPPMHGEEM